MKHETNGVENPPAKFPHYLPTWDSSFKCPHIEPHEHHERAHDADPQMPELLSSTASVKHMTPSTGTEISGIQLSALSPAGKNELALLTAQRKVLAFRDQDFAKLSPDAAVSYCSYFGRPVIHPVGPTPVGHHPEIHIAHSGGEDARLEKAASVRATSMGWHSDLSGDKQPPGLVFLYMLECPDIGGDTSFTNMALAYSKLSPAFQQRLHGLEAEHTDLGIIEGMRATGGVVRREVAKSVHPIVRTNPVTGEKALFVNPLYTTHIVGYKKEESDYLLKFLFDHIAFSQDVQVRVRWDETTVVIFDNRSVCHSAIFDFLDNRRRHLARVALSAESPYETPFTHSS